MGNVLKKSKRFEPVKQLAENKEAAAAVQMGQSFQAQEDSLGQLEKLRGYRADYVAQFKTKGESGMPAARLLEYQAFVQKLDGAIEEQIKTVQQTRVKANEHQQAFRKTNSRKKIVNKLISKSKQQEQAIQDRQEQNEADDRSFKKPRIA
ncbi:MAG: flagellar export protein FliJ [Cycloclasticus sp.]|nr:flagellar export protein FliJ [Cycloclasticus sp.]